MNRSELIRTLSEDTPMSLDDSNAVVSIFFDSIKKSLMKGERVEIRGFGSFKIKDYDSYSGRNPRTGQSVAVLSKRLPFFRVGKELKEFVNS